MKNTVSPHQFELNFNQATPLADDFRRGRFTVLVELEAPALQQPFDAGMVPGVALARRIGELEQIGGMMLTEGSETHPAVDACAIIRQAAPDLPILLTVSGRDLTPNRLRETLARAESAGVQNFLLVSGDGLQPDPHSGAGTSDLLASSKLPAGRDEGTPLRQAAATYLDSVEMLRLASGPDKKRLLGAGVNPFRYTVADEYLQFFKTTRKIASGAHFLVSQAGWDMKKLQEFQWFLQRQELQVPMLARLPLVHPDEAANLHRGFHAGVSVSRSYLAMIQRELRDAASPALFQEFQLERLGLLIAGVRHLGYSGVVLAGIRDVQTLNRVDSLIETLAAKYPTYNAWLAAWEKFHSGVTLAPGLHVFYGYRRLLAPELAMYDEMQCQPEKAALPQAGTGMLFRRWFLSGLLRPNVPEKIREMTRKLFFAGCRQPDQFLPYTYHRNPAECPKQLVFGSCGSTRSDGACEFTGAPCFFEQVLAIANRCGTLADLEKSPWNGETES